MVVSFPYCCRKDNPVNSRSLKTLMGLPPFGTLTEISMIILNFQALGGGLSVTNVTRFDNDPAARAEEVVVTLGDEIEPREVVAIEIVTPFREEVRPEVLVFCADGDLDPDDFGRICMVMGSRVVKRPRS